MDNEPVIIPAILLSDMVIREAGTGKLSYIGVFSQWNVPQMPVQVAPFFVTAHVANFRHGGMEVPISIRIESTEGQKIWSADGKVAFPGRELPAGLVVELPTPVVGLTFREAGRYIFRIVVDEEELGRRDVHVRVVAPQQPPPRA
ncbi:MAG TPA: hypothetical protein VFE31_14155 [Opitutaceae bacterium]|jgi:hypothetical protein|nr:hypothetical protein [Opitutaceae bacterium]